MKKFFTFFAAVLMAGSMMAEDVRVVTPPADATYEIYDASSIMINLGDFLVWDATIAIKDDKMYLKGLIAFPYTEDEKWIVGTISDNEVVFDSGQIVGDVYGGDRGYFLDCGFYGLDSEGEFIPTTTFSWDPVNKILKSLDYETMLYCVSRDYWPLIFNGTSYPVAPLTFTGTGKAPSALENTTAEVKTVKTIENGKVVIIKNGKKFNIIGAEF